MFVTPELGKLVYYPVEYCRLVLQALKFHTTGVRSHASTASDLCWRQLVLSVFTLAQTADELLPRTFQAKGGIEQDQSIKSVR